MSDCDDPYAYLTYCWVGCKKRENCSWYKKTFKEFLKRRDEP